MPTEVVPSLFSTAASPVTFTLTTIGTHPAPKSSPLSFLHESKSDAVTKTEMRRLLLEGQKRKYDSQVSKYVRQLADDVQGEAFDVIIASPSSHPELIDPYFQGLKAKYAAALDLSRFFTESPNARFGSKKTTAATLLADIAFNPPSDLPTHTPLRVLIVDDVYVTGEMPSVLVEKLRRNPLMGEALEVTVACPLRVLA